MQDLAGSYIQGKDGILTPNLQDEAMKARAEADKPKKETKEVPSEQK